MKNFKILLIAILISLSSILPIYAVNDDSYFLIDEAGVISDDKEEEILKKAKELSDKYKMDIAIVTITTIGSESVESFNERLFKEFNYGYGEAKDGMLFLICPEYRDYDLFKNGKPHYALSKHWNDKIIDAAKAYLKDDDYDNAFMAYLDAIDEVFSNLSDDGTLPKPPTNPLLYVGAIAISFLIAFISAQMAKGTLTTVAFNATADNYIKFDSMNLTSEKDEFLYRNVSVRAKPKETEKSSSSSSSSHSSGKY